MVANMTYNWSRFEEMEELYTDLYCTGQGGLIPLRIFSGGCEACTAVRGVMSSPLTCWSLLC